MNEAHRLEDQGEIVEAIWSYETVLRDPAIKQNLQILRAASLGLGALLLSETKTGDDTQRIDRLINRAINILTFADAHYPTDASIGLALAHAHAERFELRRRPADLLAANMLLDTIPNRTDGREPLVIQHMEALRTRLANQRNAKPRA
ncbi:hypothetical protein VW35_06875 [Devosia soli]|uniref:Uncharacterized protein n=1 Tax=Devosia soli TaxID=361041 RepID=A0A0F5LCS5_9HYPH|nr:hypothetical protein [Devosia soli]KKB80148.1 hypothetical protein VW35_06875 [Devosia soli]